MGFRFRRSVKLIPGIRLNFSGGGISTTIGGRGGSMTFGKRGTYVNLGIPGTGMSYRERIDGGGGRNNRNHYQVQDALPPIVEPPDNIISVEPERITSQDTKGIKQAIEDANKQRHQLISDIKHVKFNLLVVRIGQSISYILLFGFLIKKIQFFMQSAVAIRKKTIAELKEAKENSYVNMDISFDNEMQTRYDDIVNSFKKLMTSEKIWDIVRIEKENRYVTRSAASNRESKKTIRFDFKSLEDIKCSHPALVFKNANGADMYFYPSFVVMKGKNKTFGVIDFKELEFEFRSVRFVETDGVPKDSRVLEYTWKYVNKNGMPDRRFKNNFQIPVVEYGKIILRTNTGMHEEYEFSNHSACAVFSNYFSIYRQTIAGLSNIALPPALPVK